MKLLFSLIILSQLAWSYVFTRTASGAKLKWNTRFDTIPLAMNASNNQGLNESLVEAIFANSVAEWDQVNVIDIIESNGSINDLNNSVNRMYFSNDPSMFGTGVLAITAINFDEVSGDIANADIMINDSGFFGSFTLNSSASTNNNPYLGDVITHEIGHFLGMNHSEVIGSSMIYNVFKGQYTIESDDIYGVKDLYQGGTLESISGSVVGENGVAVFGAHVQLLKDGEVVQGQFTDEEGEFTFNVEASESYQIFISPMKSNNNISDYFRNVRSNYCNGNDFQPAIFSTCDKRDMGVGQRIVADQNLTGFVNTHVGELTVKCNTPVPPEYLRVKFSADTEDEYLAYDYSDRRKSHSGFTGYFTNSQVSLGSASSPDKLRLDLSNYPVSNSSTQLRIRAYTTQIGSPFGLNLGYKTEAAGSFTNSPPSLDGDGKFLTNQYVAIPLSTSTGNNIINLSITPYTFNSTEKNAIFGNSEVLKNENFIYYLEFEIYDPASFTAYHHDYPFEDNAACLEGNVGVTSKAYRSLINSGLQSQEEGFGCGTVDFDNDDNSGGPFSLMIGLVLMLMLGFIREKLNDFFV